MKRSTKLLLITLVIALFSACNGSNSEGRKDSIPKPKVSVILPVTIDAFEQLKEGFKDTIGERFEVQYYSAEGDPLKFETAIQSALLKKPNYIVTIGTQITNTIFSPKFTDNIPVVIAGAISSPELVDALTGVGLNPPRKSEVAIVSDSPKENIYELLNNTIKAFLPKVRKVGILYNPAEVNSKGTADKTMKVLRQSGIEVCEAVLNTAEDVDKATTHLILRNVDAIIIPHDKNAVTKAASVVKTSDEKNIPVFSLDDGTVIKDGVCVGVSVNYKTIGNLIGQTLLNIEVNKFKASNLPIAAVQSARIYVNVKKMNALGIRYPDLQNSIIERVNE